MPNRKRTNRESTIQSPGITNDIEAQAIGVIPTKPGAKNRLPENSARDKPLVRSKGTIHRSTKGDTAGRVPGLRRIGS